MATTANGPAHGPKKIFGRDNANFTPRRAGDRLDISTIPELTPSQEEHGDSYSAQISATYAHRSILDHHMHNGSDVGNHLECYYYSSPQGRLELDRRMTGRRKPSPEYEKIKKFINNHDVINDYPITFTPEESEKIRHDVNTGKKMMESDFSKPTTPYDTDRRDTREILHALSHYSQEWMSLLTTKQQESISHLTSNGFIFLQGSLYPDDHEIFSHPAFQSIINYEDYDHYPPVKASKEKMKKKREYSQDLTDLVLSSFDNAPILDTPIMSYRGTDMDEIRDLVGDTTSSHEEFREKVLSGNFKDSDVSENSRIMNIPISSSAHSDTGSGFGAGVVLEIKRQTITSPVNVSAWGPAEAEILTNPLSSYTIKDIYMKPAGESGEFMVVQLEENI